MRRFLARLLITTLGLWIASALIPPMEIRGIGTLLAAAFLLSLVNAVVRPVLVVLTLPITILTLGIFLLVINAAMLSLVAWLLPGFDLGGFLSALAGWLIVSVVSWCASWFVRSGVD